MADERETRSDEELEDTAAIAPRAKEIFLDALELEPAKRDSFILDAVQDDLLVLARVRDLLAANDQAEQLMADVPGLPVAGIEELTIDLGPGDRVGPYELTETIGEGGFGVVFQALQTHPVRRRVALKIVKLGMDTREVISRFEAERQTLAMMDHPNISTVFDAGTTERGRPYFVMEHVDGEPITEYCLRRRLGRLARLELFRTVCMALQHAHQKGVIHRDIKPSNVLVATVDGQAVPKVIDFGIAKATHGGRMHGGSVLTREGLFVGTPAYMSPEQAAAATDIDTRADVYGLGALLYELLCGVPPFDLAELEPLGLMDVLKHIRERDPVPPSRRVGSCGAHASGSTTGATLRLSAELDWIVMRSLEKDRARRYPTAWDLGADIGRLLANEPIQAAPASTWYRLTKLARRHRASAFVIAGLVLALIGGAAVASLGFFAARASATAAKVSEADARESAKQARLEKDRVLQLSAFQRLADLEDEARTLWPARAELAPNYRAWLERAAELLEGSEGASAGLESHREQRARLEARAQRRGDGSFEFANDEDRWWHTQLSQLVARLEAFDDPENGLVSGISPEFGWGIERRLGYVEGLAARTLAAAEVRALWEETSAALAQSPYYRGVELTPQLGLVPIGRDPDSRLFEFAYPLTGALPERGPTGQLTIDGDSAVVFVLLPGGTYDRGAQNQYPTGSNYDPLAGGDEWPVREVTVTAFFLSKYELSQGQWERFTADRPSGYDASTPIAGVPIDRRHPVEQISWLRAREVITRMDLRLPTEAEWEYAARAESSTPWPTGAQRESLDGYANLADLSAARAGGSWPAIGDWPGFDDGWPAHAPAGALRANLFGLHHMLGNVWEWCGDGYIGSFLDDPPPDPFVPPETSQSRVRRGGGFTSATASLRVTNRDPMMPTAQAPSTGVRPALSLR